MSIQEILSELQNCEKLQLFPKKISNFKLFLELKESPIGIDIFNYENNNKFAKISLFYNIATKDYILKDKGIVPNDTKDDNNDFYLGLWWGVFLLTFFVMTIIINSTFFGTEAMYNKLSHSGVIIITVILWILFFIQDTIIIRKFNKMNQLLFANQSKL